MNNVLVNVELLEIILVHLDMATLLVSAQRVSKTWHNVIAESPALQQALYFRAATVPLHLRSGNTIGSNSKTPPPPRPLLNPLLLEKFSPCFFDFDDNRARWRRSSSFYTLPWTARPHEELRHTHLTRPDTVHIIRNPPPHSKTPQEGEREEEEEEEEEGARRRFTRRGASWRHMLVAQPPPLQMGYVSPSSPLHAANLTIGKALLVATPTDGRDEDGGGLRMGQLYDFVQRRAGHHDLHSLWFRVQWMRFRGSTYHAAAGWACQELLQHKTCVVVEAVDHDDATLDQHPPAPPDVAAFDAAFRCDEAAALESKVEMEEEVEVPSEHLVLPTEVCVWDPEDKIVRLCEVDGYQRSRAGIRGHVECFLMGKKCRDDECTVFTKPMWLEIRDELELIASFRTYGALRNSTVPHASTRWPKFHEKYLPAPVSR
ncbi:hypothetical protein PG988_011572 [Apiospora saccharicola]